MSVMCSARVPVGPGTVRAARCRPPKGRSQSSPGRRGRAVLPARRWEEAPWPKRGPPPPPPPRKRASTRRGPSRFFLLPALRWIKSCSSARRRRSSKRLSLPEGEALGHLGRGCRDLRVLRPTGASSVPLPASRSHHCPGPCLASTAVAAIMRWRQLGEMWSSVLARSRQSLCVESSGRCNWGSSTCAPGVGGAAPSTAPATPASAVGAPRGSMMV